MRLQKFIAQAGFASRRKAEELIRNGRVSINGQTVRRMGLHVVESDIVKVDGKEIGRREDKVYILLYKPEGYVTTVKDQFSRKTVMNLLEGVRQRVYPVGRLDYETSGFLLLTNDGELTEKMTHPRYGIGKTYEALVEGTLSREDVEAFKSGIDIGGYVTAPAQLEIKKICGDKTIAEISLYEGKNRQIRRMFKAIGHPVRSLKRIAEGGISLGNLKKGDWRYLSSDEVKKLLSSF